MKFDYMFCVPELVCYDGEEGDGGTPPETKTTGKTFTQDDVNKFLAEDRRKHQEKLKTLESSYEKILEDKTLAAEARTQLETELEDLRSQFRTKEQQVDHEKKQQKAEYEAKLTQATEAAKRYEGLYTSFVIDASIREAAKANEAFSEDQITGLIRGQTKVQEVLDENGKPTGKFAPMTKFQDVDAEGKPIETLRTPADAVKRMKELPNLWGNLFRANVVSGVGQGAATGGVTPGAGAQIDVSRLTPEQYRKIRKENPALLGLRSR